MKYVYLLQSCSSPDRYYTGSTNNFPERLKAHNAGHSPHTAKYAPWHAVVVICFADDQRAIEFERYLKSGSGRAFAMKHFRP
jgi:predicted GIY-YIG superfamily endonuclease